MIRVTEVPAADSYNELSERAMPLDPGPSELTQPVIARVRHAVKWQLGDRLARVVARAIHFLVDGPDPLEWKEQQGVLEIVLPWPLRLAIVAALAWAAALWSDTGIGQQLVWGLQSAALIVVSIAAAYFWQILVVDSAIAVLWLLPLPPGTALHIVTFVNREIGHFKLIAIWLLLVLASSVSLSVQLGGTAAVLLLGPPLLNGLARANLRWLSGGQQLESYGDLLWRRRLLIYAATLLGLLAIAARAPHQIRGVLPLILAVSGGLALRTLRHVRRNRRVAAERDQTKLDTLATFRRAQASVASVADPLGALLVVAALVGVVAASWWQRKKLDDDIRPTLDGVALPIDSCGQDPHRPAASDIALYLMGDTQTHELSGARFPGQSELAEAFVHTAARPVALDVLSLAALGHFAREFGELAAQRAEQGASPLRWAHLGDLADLGCERELTRALSALSRFSAQPAGIAIGNHELSFQGSFHWSPFWNSACSSPPLDKAKAVDALERSLTPAVSEQGGEVVSIAAHPLYPHSRALVTVVPLGETAARRTRHGVLGVFLDSSDGRAFDRGNPGAFGAISALQLERAEAALQRVRAQRGGAYLEDPVYVLFQHIPFGELASDSRTRLARFIERLDERDGLFAAPRVLALVSAHTHVAAAHRHCVGHRVLREIVVGSTIDPPQQAALLEIGPDDAGRTSLSVRTLQAVARHGVTCGASHAVAATQCKRVAAKLQAAPECAPLWAAASTEGPARDCQELERATKLADDLASLRTYSGPRDPRDKYQLQEREAEQLLACVCRGDRCQPGEHPFAGDTYGDTLAPLLDDPERAEELTCLAWAASTCQAHKSARPALGEALRCAFDDPTLPAERVAVATLEATTCY